MKVSARHFVAFGAVALLLGNVGRIPLGALGGRTAPFVVADVAVMFVWLALAAVVLSGRVRMTLDEISIPVAAFVAVATVSRSGSAFLYSVTASDKWIGGWG